MKKISTFLHHLFIPHEHNNFRAHVTQVHALSSYLIFFMAMAFFINYIHATSNILGYATDITVDKLYSLTNVQREENNLAKLKYNDQLAEAAKNKAADMFAHNYWAHFGPDGTTPWSFILKSGYKYEYAGENLAKNFMFSDGVVDAWMKSPSHRENLLRPEYSDVGFAIANGTLNGEETTLVVQMFGKPLGGDSIAMQTEEGKDVAPAPEVQEVQQAKPVYAAERPSVPEIKVTQALGEQTKPSWTRIFYNTNVLFLTFLIVAFILDMFVAVKLDIIHVRFGGKTLIHIIFLVFILTGIVIIANGKIL